MANVADVLGKVTGAAAGTVGGGVNSVISAGVNIPTQLVSAAATAVDGTVVGVGEGVVVGSGLATTGVTSFVDLICAWARGIIGTAGGYLNNAVIDVVKVVDKEAAENLPRDPDLKKHFGELGNVIGTAIDGSGESKGIGLNGSRSSLSWASPSATWGGDNLFSAISNGLEALVPSNDSANDSTKDKPADVGMLQSTVGGIVGLINGVGNTLSTLIPGGNTAQKPVASSEEKPAASSEETPSGDNLFSAISNGLEALVPSNDSAQGKSAAGGILGSVASGILGLIDGIGGAVASLIPGGNTAQKSVASSEETPSEATLAQSQSADVPASDSFVASAYDPLHDTANTVPVIM